jgi:hypothetical protein
MITKSCNNLKTQTLKFFIGLVAGILVYVATQLYF